MIEILISRYLSPCISFGTRISAKHHEIFISNNYLIMAIAICIICLFENLR